MGSSSSSSEKSYDPVGSYIQAYASLKSINLAEQQDARAGDLYDTYKSTFLPYDQKVMEANQTALPSQTAYQVAANTEATRDIQQGQANKDALRAEQLKEIDRSSPVADAFYQAALAGIKPDYEGVMGRATGDVAQGYGTAGAALARNNARMGITPDSGAAQSAALSTSAAYAKDSALARTAARMQEKARVEDTNFNRLGSAMNARGMASGLAGTGVQGGALSTLGGYGTTSSLSGSLQASGQAISGMGQIASIQPRVTGETTTRNDGGAGIASSLSSVGGMALGGYLSK